MIKFIKNHPFYFFLIILALAFAAGAYQGSKRVDKVTAGTTTTEGYVRPLYQD